MTCPICDHTRHCVTKGVFWCPRCGTLDKDVPKLVAFVRALCNNLPVEIKKELRQLGGLEGIWPE